MGERNLVAVSIKHTIYGWKFGMRAGCGEAEQKTKRSGRLAVIHNILTTQKCTPSASGRKAVMVLVMYARWMNRCRCVSVFARNTKNMTQYLFHSISTSNTASALACRWINQRRADNG